MSRYTGPRLKKCRALDADLPGLTRKRRKRTYPPGQHGNNFRRKVSDYGRRLTEKQKIRFNYGLGEKQLRRLVSDARRSQLSTGDKLMELLDRRLDNVVFRAGFAPTIPAARQLVNHGHFQVNGRKVDIASYRVRIGEVISLKEKSQNLECVVVSMENPSLMSPDWLDLNRNQRTATVSSLPTIESVPFPLDIQLIVEYYARLL